MLKHLALVAIGGGIGSALRYLVSVWTYRLGPSQTPPGGSPAGIAPLVAFPWGTLAVNLIGCLAIGALAGWTAHRHAEGITVAPFAAMDRDAKLFVVTGLLGGFTTFSAFGIETIALLRDGAPARAAAYIVASVLLGLTLAWIGWTIGLRLAPPAPSTLGT